MRGIFVRVCLGLVLVSSGAMGAAAQDTRAGDVSIAASLGFTADPGSFLLGFEVPFNVTDDVSVGPLLQLGLDDDWTIVAPTANVRYAFDLSGASNPDVRRLRPFVQGGLGFAYLEKERSGRSDRDDTGFLFNMGGGVEYFITDNFALGSNVMFNILPDEVVDEHFFFSWQVGTARFVF